MKVVAWILLGPFVVLFVIFAWTAIFLVWPLVYLVCKLDDTPCPPPWELCWDGGRRWHERRSVKS